MPSTRCQCGTNTASRVSLAFDLHQVFEKKRVLVVGCGETGLDLTYRAVIAPAKEVSLLARRGFLSVPTEGAGKGVPLDTMIPNLFESSYVHPWLEWCDLYTIRPHRPTSCAHPLRARALVRSLYHPWLEWCGLYTIRPHRPTPCARARARLFVVPQLRLACGGHRAPSVSLGQCATDPRHAIGSLKTFGAGGGAGRAGGEVIVP